MPFNLGFIGGGNMSTAIVRGILQKDAHPASKIWVSGPHLQNLRHWQDMGTNVTTDNGEVFSKCDIVILGVKPAMLQNSVDGIKETLKCEPNKTVLVVSMLAGITLQALDNAFSQIKSMDNIDIIRIMPNTPITVGQGICLYTPGKTVTNAECLNLVNLLSSSCVCERVAEPLMDSLGVLTACGPAFMYIVIEALADGAVKQGVPREQATKFAAQLLVGSGQMVLQTGKHPGLLKDEVCSPGGSTICGVSALENGQLRATLINAIEAATQKTKGIGK